MDITDILSKVDHTNLKQTAKWEDINKLCIEGIKYGVASVCIPPSFVKAVKDTYGEKLNVCTVIGFPNGYNTTKTKVFETIDAIDNGADEIDMVINIGWLKDGRFEDIYNEICAIREVCGDKVLKVIIETCLLTDEEKVKMCEIVTNSKADYIKTSTGFSTAGATFDDVILFRNNVGKDIKIKAAGGIKSIDDAERFVNEGATRLGTSRIIGILEAK